MVQWVIDALSQSDWVGTLYIIGLSEQAGLTSEKHCVICRMKAVSLKTSTPVWSAQRRIALKSQK